MPNPAWVKGCASPNPKGGKIHEEYIPGLKRAYKTSVARNIDRFLKEELTPMKLKRLYDAQSASGKKDLILGLTPYSTAKKVSKTTVEKLTAEEVIALRDEIKKIKDSDEIFTETD